MNKTNHTKQRIRPTDSPDPLCEELEPRLLLSADAIDAALPDAVSAPDSQAPVVSVLDEATLQSLTSIDDATPSVSQTEQRLELV
ncbi:MAG: hypothetical protein RLZ44_1016, partial [Pseudomonadota bacterium]